MLADLGLSAARIRTAWSSIGFRPDRGSRWALPPPAGWQTGNDVCGDGLRPVATFRTAFECGQQGTVERHRTHGLEHLSDLGDGADTFWQGGAVDPRDGDCGSVTEHGDGSQWLRNLERQTGGGQPAQHLHPPGHGSGGQRAPLPDISVPQHRPEIRKIDPNRTEIFSPKAISSSAVSELGVLTGLSSTTPVVLRVDGLSLV